MVQRYVNLSKSHKAEAIQRPKDCYDLLQWIFRRL
jgi:hypothetical protein